MELVLRFKLLSDAAPGTGEGRASAVDSEVPFDDHGLPEIPGKRIKGLIREAILELEDFGLVDRGTAAEVCGTGDRDGIIGVRNARVPGADNIAVWLAWCRSIAPMDFSPTRVLDCFTTLREQTAIDRESGSAKRNSLRRTRVIRRNVEFGCPVVVDDGSSDVAFVQATLALAAAGVRRLGKSRNRGFGRVECALVRDKDDLTAMELERRSRGE